MFSIVLYGKYDTGKTETLKNFINILKNSGYSQIKFEDLNGGNDIRTVFEKDNKKILVTTRGDSRNDLENDFEYFDNCDIFICGARTRGGTNDFINGKFNKENIFWVLKSAIYIDKKYQTVLSYDNLIKQQNEEQANQLFVLLENTIKII